MINIPKSWLIGAGVLAIGAGLAFIILAVALKEDDGPLRTGTSQVTTTTGACGNLRSSPDGPLITLNALPGEAVAGRNMSIPFTVEDGDGITDITICEGNVAVQPSPQFLEGSTYQEILFNWRPRQAGIIRLQIQATDLQGNQSAEVINITVVEAEIPEIVLVFIMRPGINPISLIAGFGVCWDELLAINTNLNALDLGDELRIPYKGGREIGRDFDPAEDCSLDEEAQNALERPETFFQHWDRFLVNPEEGPSEGPTARSFPPRTTVFPVGMSWERALRLGRGYGCHAFQTGYDGTDCPTDKPFFHTGADFGVSKGLPITSASPGRVIHAGPDQGDFDCSYLPGSEEPHVGYGNYVVIQNGTTYFLYAHLSEIVVQVGDTFDEHGFLVGFAGSTGCSTAPHLHFEVREGRNAAANVTDPIPYLRDLEESFSTSES